MNKDIAGGMLVIRLFLVAVFGAAAIVGLMIIVRNGSALLQMALAGVMIPPLFVLVALLLSAAWQALQILTGPSAPHMHAFTEGVKAIEPTQPAAVEAAPAQPAETPFEEHLARVRQQHAYWLQRRRERHGGKS